MAAVKLMENKNASLQESLSAETRFKMDLFSALGETRRQLDSVLSEFIGTTIQSNVIQRHLIIDLLLFEVQLENKERELVQLNDAFKCILKSVTNGAPQNNTITNSLGNPNNSNNSAPTSSSSSSSSSSSFTSELSNFSQTAGQQHLQGFDPLTFLNGNSGLGATSSPPTSATPPGTNKLTN